MDSDRTNVTPDLGAPSFEAAWIAPGLWNGFVRPFFERAEADRVVAWIMSDPFDGETVEWSGELGRYCLTIAGTPYLHEYPTVDRTGTVLHGIGVDELSWIESPAGSETAG